MKYSVYLSSRAKKQFKKLDDHIRRKINSELAASPRVIKIHSDSVLEETGEDILRQYEDQDFSYTDAVSFVVMKQYGIIHAFCFDKYFVTAGFTVIP